MPLCNTAIDIINTKRQEHANAQLSRQHKDLQDDNKLLHQLLKEKEENIAAVSQSGCCHTLYLSVVQLLRQNSEIQHDMLNVSVHNRSRAEVANNGTVSQR